MKERDVNWALAVVVVLAIMGVIAHYSGCSDRRSTESAEERARENW